MKLYILPTAILASLLTIVSQGGVKGNEVAHAQHQKQHAFEAPLLVQNQNDSSLGTEVASKHRGNVFLIRHGEKLRGGRSGLSLLGQQRAQCIKKVFGSKHSTRKVDYIMAQDFSRDGRRSRPFKTVEPLANHLGLRIDRDCNRDDPHCVVRKVEERTALGENVLIVWEHGRLTSIAAGLGVKGVAYPRRRYDIIFHLRRSSKKHLLESSPTNTSPTSPNEDKADATKHHPATGHWKVRSIVSEECRGIDGRWIDWHAHKGSRASQRLVDDESWEDDEEREDDLKEIFGSFEVAS